MNPRILIVDDALFMRSMIKDILVGSGKFDVAGEASNGLEAVAKFTDSQPDLITMDIVMPVMDGIEATKEILRKDPSAKIIICSSLGQEPLVMESIAVGAKDFIIKPFSADTILKTIDKVLKMK